MVRIFNVYYVLKIFKRSIIQIHKLKLSKLQKKKKKRLTFPFTCHAMGLKKTWLQSEEGEEVGKGYPSPFYLEDVFLNILELTPGI